MNATSTYDLIYKGLSEEDRSKIQSELSEIIDKILERELPSFSLAIGKAVEQMVTQVGLWKEWVEENNGSYQFIDVLQKGIWESMMKTDPKTIGEWDMRHLITAWRLKFPEEYSEIVNSELHKELEETKKSLEFERQCNRRY